MPEISAEQVGNLLRHAEAAEEAKAVADQARAALDEALLDTAREARVGVKELSAVTGLHHNSIRAGIQRAAGETTIDFEQPELEIPAGGAGDGVSISAHMAAAFPTGVQANAQRSTTEVRAGPRTIAHGQQGLQR